VNFLYIWRGAAKLRWAGEGAQRIVLRVDKTKKMGARSARKVSRPKSTDVKNKLLEGSLCLTCMALSIIEFPAFHHYFALFLRRSTGNVSDRKIILSVKPLDFRISPTYLD
jgi:hypothetical protein